MPHLGLNTVSVRLLPGRNPYCGGVPVVGACTSRDHRLIPFVPLGRALWLIRTSGALTRALERPNIPMPDG